MIKIYTLTRLRACRLNVTDGRVTITVNFNPSYGTQKNANGKIVVTDPNVQAVMEADEKFGVVYDLTDCHEDESVKTVKNIKGETFIEPAATGKKIRTRQQMANEKAKEKAAAKTGADGLVFPDINAVIDYLAEKGIVWQSEDELHELMAKHNLVLKEE